MRKRNNSLIFLTFSQLVEYNTFINSDEKTIERDSHVSIWLLKRLGDGVSLRQPETCRSALKFPF
ncbi:hypothetical protein C6370_02195 [Bacillus atrophaeus]|nr:hypothetical protein BaGK_08640 [Bacillus atrophaeus]ATO29229.1 hypothetical protein RA13_15470 [Bacillus atrophaeus]KAA6452293.1 hypothetical protein DX926_08055 [Bacillus atrophaeus]MDR4396778.1 hypothetical protein [Bacillus atrophaeus]PRR89719.1 hypothetical protein C6W23_10885 [Bacillus atrophaeus]